MTIKTAQNIPDFVDVVEENMRGYNVWHLLTLKSTASDLSAVSTPTKLCL